MVARLVVSAEDGAAPTSISFTARGGTVTASLPEDFFPDTPIRPIGWSPSGRYFAVVALTMDRDMLIFSASDGTVASRLALNLALPYCTNDDAPCVAAWDAREDVVHFLVRDMRSDGATQLMVAGPDVPVIEAARHFGWTDRPALSTGDQEALAGRGPGGPVLLTGLAGYFNEGGQVVEATPLDPAGSAVTYDLGASRMLAGVMAPQGDLFAVLQDEGGERQLVLFSPDGAKQRDLWSGP
jgi:hypothetical protein